MHECNVNANSNEKHLGHEILKELAQGPCQTDSLRQVFCISTLLDANLELGFLVELALI